jgi:hypothetical protein
MEIINLNCININRGDVIMPIKDSLILKSDSQQWKEIIRMRSDLHHKYFAYWLNNNLFSLAWWLMLILIILLWVIWWKHVNKAKLLEIVTFGVMVGLLASIIDIIGCENVLWGYPNDLDPLITPLTVTDFCLIPISYMFLYQYFVNWKSFITTSIILSALYVFVAEPLAVKLDIFQLHNWRHIYDFPMYLLLALSLKWVLNKIMLIQNNR